MGHAGDCAATGHAGACAATGRLTVVVWTGSWAALVELRRFSTNSKSSSLSPHVLAERFLCVWRRFRPACFTLRVLNGVRLNDQTEHRKNAQQQII